MRDMQESVQLVPVAGGKFKLAFPPGWTVANANPAREEPMSKQDRVLGAISLDAITNQKPSWPSV